MFGFELGGILDILWLLGGDNRKKNTRKKLRNSHAPRLLYHLSFMAVRATERTLMQQATPPRALREHDLKEAALPFISPHRLTHVVLALVSMEVSS